MRNIFLQQISRLDNINEYHLIRILILMFITTEKKEIKKINGITKLVKLDFLLRYPLALERALDYIGGDVTKLAIREEEKTGVESKMIRYKYGPWDKRYRIFLAMLDAQGLLRVTNEKETIIIEITQSGEKFARELLLQPEFESYVSRSRIIKSNFGDLSATRLKDMMYEIIPGLKFMEFGEWISNEILL